MYPFTQLIELEQCRVNVNVLTVTECGPLSPVAHAIATVIGQSYLAVVEYQCEEGHRYTSGALKRTCQADQRWSGVTPVCTGKLS